KIRNLRNFKGSYFVQAFLKGTYSGVLLTSSPNRPDCMLIEYSETPMDVTSGKNVDFLHVSRLDLSFNRNELTKDQCENFYDLVLISKKIEQHFNRPQNIEWVISNNKVFILQTREIINGCLIPGEIDVCTFDSFKTGNRISVLNEQLKPNTILNASVFLDIWSHSGSLGVLEAKKVVKKNYESMPFLVFENECLVETYLLASNLSYSSTSCTTLLKRIYSELLPEYYEFLRWSKETSIQLIWRYFLVNVYPTILEYGMKAEIEFGSISGRNKLFEKFGFTRVNNGTNSFELGFHTDCDELNIYNLYEEGYECYDNYFDLIPDYHLADTPFYSSDYNSRTLDDLSFIKNDLNKHISVLFKVLKNKCVFMAQHTGLNRDIVYLTIDELGMVDSFTDRLSGIIRYRKEINDKKTYRIELTKRTEGQLLRGRIVSGEFPLKGTLVSAKMVLDGEVLPDNAVLLTQFFDPSLIKYLPILNGVISETGNYLSHWAIVAREQYVSCLINCHNAVSTLKVGETVSVDSNGIIEREK
ncbi:hypothetical protein HOG98_08775, partial [bacterium]|nr:hypothetical protein [bacterium]